MKGGEERVKFLLSLLGVLDNVVDQLTPEIRGMLEKFLGELAAKAANTKNPWDDLAVRLLKGVFGL